MIRTTVKPVAISLPLELLDKIDKQRGDVNRSRFITRLLEREMAPKKRRALPRPLAHAAEPAHPEAVPA